MKFGNEIWLIIFWEYISPKLFAVGYAETEIIIRLSVQLFELVVSTGTLRYMYNQLNLYI
jgi:hypothetical protein